MNRFTQEYWEKKYSENETGWDIGSISTPIKTYIDQLENKELKILIPGAGNGHEVEYLYKNGFKNVSVIDIAEQPLKNLKKRIPNFPKEQLIHSNFFEYEGTFDLILEQTFFCALEPALRTEYIDKMYDLINEGGKLVGLLFDFPLNVDNEPPYGGSIIEYIQLFFAKFEIRVFEKCYNSIKPRIGNELFFIFAKK